MATDVHSQVRAFGSLAQEVMDEGVTGVVAMRYNVYVVTAAQFVDDLYATLVQGRSLGESASMGRKQLSAQADRTISFDPCPLLVAPGAYVEERSVTAAGEIRDGLGYHPAATFSWERRA